MINKIIQWFRKTFLHQEKQVILSPSGDAIIRYIIRKYVNCEEDFVQKYEDTIDIFKKYLPLSPSAMKVLQAENNEEERKELEHDLAAVILLAVFFSSITSETEKYYNLIKNEQIKNIIKNITEEVKNHTK